MQHSNKISIGTASTADDRKRAVYEALLCLVATVLTVIDLCRRLLVFFLQGTCRMCVKLIFILLLAATGVLAYCILVALSLISGPAAHSQLP